MEFKLNRRNVYIRWAVVAALIIGSEIILYEGTFNPLNIVLFCILSTNIYKTLKEHTDVYTIKDGVLFSKEQNVEIPLNEVDEVIFKRSAWNHNAGTTNQSHGYQYYINYKNEEFELLTTCVNEKGRTILDALVYDHNLNQREV